MITGSRAIPGTRQTALARALFSQIREGGVSGRVWSLSWAEKSWSTSSSTSAAASRPLLFEP